MSSRRALLQVHIQAKEVQLSPETTEGPLCCYHCGPGQLLWKKSSLTSFPHFPLASGGFFLGGY